MLSVSPGDKIAARSAVGTALEEARRMRDADFELEKMKLAKRIKHATQPPQANSPNRAAYFLLFPGASKVYAQYSQRLEKTGN